MSRSRKWEVISCKLVRREEVNCMYEVVKLESPPGLSCFNRSACPPIASCLQTKSAQQIKSITDGPIGDLGLNVDACILAYPTRFSATFTRS